MPDAQTRITTTMSMSYRIRTLYKLRNYLSPPHLRDLPIEYQRELCAYFLRHNPAWLSDVLSFIPDASAELVANAIMKVDHELELGDLLFDAAVACCSLEIDAQIETVFLAEANEHGRWDADTGDLIGWEHERPDGT